MKGGKGLFSMQKKNTHMLAKQKKQIHEEEFYGKKTRK